MRKEDLHRAEANAKKIQQKGVKTSIDKLIQDNKVLSNVSMQYMRKRNLLYMLLYLQNPNHFIFKDTYAKEIFLDLNERDACIAKAEKYRNELLNGQIN